MPRINNIVANLSTTFSSTCGISYFYLLNYLTLFEKLFCTWYYQPYLDVCYKIFQENDLKKIQKNYSIVYLRYKFLSKILLCLIYKWCFILENILLFYYFKYYFIILNMIIMSW